MLDYVKTILLKVSFDKTLFEKELKKGLKALEEHEMVLLRQWCYEKFSNIYQPILLNTFPSIDAA
ncbi:hypothetical protein [Pontibacter cellulosilyticus]|uniref:Uncharacterized protein n=1 Tax=Pontibacter cellulosilyticus TaxID=1720253 RepID=A0A923N916_9BACT|nr:hypothetical protein [Pontibacter cellulosilyticus]MBC5994002.1 hypothetical protein [Pontibacter cellulosilyticus]